MENGDVFDEYIYCTTWCNTQLMMKLMDMSPPNTNGTLKSLQLHESADARALKR